MTTDITELAQSMKEHAGYIIDLLTHEPENEEAIIHAYDQADRLFSAENVLLLVEALEKAQAKNALVAGGIEASAKLHGRIAELESRTVTVKLPDCDLAAVQHMSGGSKDYSNGFVDGTQNAIRAMRDAGVDVREAE